MWQVQILCKDGSCSEKQAITFQVMQRTGCGKGPYPAGSIGEYCIPTQGMNGDVFGVLKDARGRRLPSSCKASSSSSNGGSTFGCVYDSIIIDGVEQNVGKDGFYLQEVDRNAPIGSVSYKGDLVSTSPDYMSFLPKGKRLFSFVHMEAPHPSNIQVANFL